MRASIDLCPNCGAEGEQPIAACPHCDAEPGCERCRCEGGDLWHGPSCCDKAREEAEESLARVQEELRAESEAANDRAEAARSSVLAAGGDHEDAALAAYLARWDALRLEGEP